MPLDTSNFPLEVQVAFFVYEFLSDRWDGMSGTYLGKDWVDTPHIMSLYEVEDQKTVLYFAKLYERLTIEYYAEESSKKRKADERKAKAGGKNYTHNVSG